jgi:hypothetical protein
MLISHHTKAGDEMAAEGSDYANPIEGWFIPITYLSARGPKRAYDMTRCGAGTATVPHMIV